MHLEDSVGATMGEVAGEEDQCSAPRRNQSNRGEDRREAGIADNSTQLSAKRHVHHAIRVLQDMPAEVAEIRLRISYNHLSWTKHAAL